MTIAIVQGVFSLRPEDRDAFIENAVEGMRSARAEEGCLEYVMAADPVDPGRVVLSERWQSTEHLDKHLQRLQAADRPAGTGPAPLSREITVFEVASSRPLG